MIGVVLVAGVQFLSRNGVSLMEGALVHFTEAKEIQTIEDKAMIEEVPA